MFFRVTLAAVTNKPQMCVTSCNKHLFHGLITISGDGFPLDGDLGIQAPSIL